MKLHLMIDVETLGLSPRAPIVSLGAVLFDQEGFYQTFYRAAKPELGGPFEPDFDTVRWWMRQSDEARAVFQDPEATDVGTMLMRFSFWLEEHCFGKKYKVWAKPTHKDIPWLEHNLRTFGQDIPWSHRDVLDLQTAIHLLDPNGELQPPDNTEHHNALADAQWQVTYLQALLAKGLG